MVHRIKWTEQRKVQNKGFCKKSRPFRKIRGGYTSELLLHVPSRDWAINRKWQAQTLCPEFSGTPFPPPSGRMQTWYFSKEQGTDFTCSWCPEVAAACCERNQEQRFRRGRQKARAGSKWTGLGPQSRAENRRPCLLWRWETVTLSDPG